MRIDDAARKVLTRAVRTEAALLRVPLGALDRRVVTPLLGEKSPAHTLLAQGVLTLDMLAGRVPDQYSHPQPVAEFWEPQAQTDAGASPDGPSPDARPTLSDEQELRVEGLTEQILAAEETETFAGELADDSEIRRVQAEIRAKQIVEDETAPE